ncbi:hypothetical protein [Corynebacterium aquilae]|uniref:hypothetical protein n=1 Tax=Corynebacterium aquilae TaxID=203263 RepID=UPI000951ECDE|nr:hypothetical protein [Corynebacterium aquilae]
MERLTLIFAKGTTPSKWVNRFEDRGLGAITLVERDDAFAALMAASDPDAQAVCESTPQGAQPAENPDSTGDDPHKDLGGAAKGEQPAAPRPPQLPIALVRLPDPRISAALEEQRIHLVRLYEEQPGVLLPKDNELTLLDTLSRADIADETIMYEPTADGPVDVRAVREAVLVVAANVGVAIGPRPLFRSLNNKDTEARDFHGAAPTTIALAWLRDDDCDSIQDFVGIARGRKQSSSRTAQAPAATGKKKPNAKATSRGGKKDQQRASSSPRSGARRAAKRNTRGRRR